MEKVFGVILIIVLVLMLAGPLLRRWVVPALHRWVMGKMEDRFRTMAGMPTRKEERKARRKEERETRSGRSPQGARATAQHTRRHVDLQTVAEDVEYVEVKSVSVEVSIGKTVDKDGKEKVVVEEQIEDAEYIEIR